MNFQRSKLTNGVNTAHLHHICVKQDGEEDGPENLGEVALAASPFFIPAKV